MHGVMYWSSESPGSTRSRLITWQDRRCSAAFLAALPPSSPYALSAGYGCATTAWMARQGPKGFLDDFDRAGNMQITAEGVEAEQDGFVPESPKVFPLRVVSKLHRSVIIDQSSGRD